MENEIHLGFESVLLIKVLYLKVDSDPTQSWNWRLEHVVRSLPESRLQMGVFALGVFATNPFCHLLLDVIAIYIAGARRQLSL